MKRKKMVIMILLIFILFIFICYRCDMKQMIIILERILHI